MKNYAVYLLVPLMSGLLITAQTLWAWGIKKDHLLEGSGGTIFINLITNYKIWAGALIYVVATGVYFLVVSKGKFFNVQIILVSLTMIFATLIAYFLFGEKISAWNLAGVAIVLIGLLFVVR